MMHPGAELVLSIHKWALQLVLREQASRTSIPGPRTPGCPLGRLVKRADVATALAIVRDMDGYSGEKELEFFSQVQADEFADQRSYSRARTEQEEQADQVVSSIRRYHRGEDLRLMEQVASVPTWKQLEDHWPGRDWRSLRDDYERMAKKYWQSEKFFLSHVADFALKVDRMRELCA